MPQRNHVVSMLSGFAGSFNASSLIPSEKPPTTLQEKESFSQKREARRRRLKEIRSGCKRFLAFLFSQIGLSILVIGYTIIGGLLFRAVELENEKEVKLRGKELRDGLADQFSDGILREIRFQLSSYDTQKSVYYKPNYWNQPQLTNEVKTISRTHRSLCERKEVARIRQWLSVIDYTLRQKTRQELHRSLRNLVKMMENTGWNGEDSMDELKWTWEGAVLFAVTVITTIGYGHAVPKTNIGKFLTIIYALVGIPLVFLYLTNIGDYLATLFRVLYAKVCRRCCEGSCMKRKKLRRHHFHNHLQIWNPHTHESDSEIDNEEDLLNRSTIQVLHRIGSPVAKFANIGDIYDAKGGSKVETKSNNLLENLFNEAAPAKTKPNRNGHVRGTANEACSLKETKHTFSALNNKISKTILTGFGENCNSVPQITLSDFPASMTEECESLNYPSFDTISCPPQPLYRSIIDTSVHDNCTQTVLHAKPTGSMTVKDLEKSFVTGFYLRSYRQEQRHKKWQRQRFKQQSPVISNPIENNKLFPPFNNAEKKLNTNYYPFTPSLECTKHKSEFISVADNTQSTSKCSIYVSQYPRVEVVNKSRLSLIDSLAGSGSDLEVQLSYYSDESFQAEKEDYDIFPFSSRSDKVANGRTVDGEDMRNVTVPISLSIMIMTTYILIGAIVFCIWEDQNYLKWSYFCFVTLSTIGFGDIVPGTKIDSTNPQEKLIIITVYVAIGLSVFAMCFKLMQEEVVSKFKWLSRKVSRLKRRVQKQKSDRISLKTINEPTQI